MAGPYRTILNLEIEPTSGDYRLINMAKLSGRVLTENVSTNTLWADYMDENFYPVDNSIGVVFTVYIAEAGTYVVRWAGSGSFTAVSFGARTNASSGIYTGGGADGSIVTNGRMTFVATQDNQESSVTLRGTSMSNFLICKLDEESAYDSGQRVRNTFKSWISALNPSYIRFMDASAVYDSPISAWADRPSLNQLSYGTTKIFDDRKIGDIGGSGTFRYSAAAYPGMPVSYTDGEIVHGRVPTSGQTPTSPGVALAMNKSRHFNIGNLTANGGLASAYDGVDSKVASSCAALASATAAYIGKETWLNTPVGGVEVFPSSDQGFTTAGGNITVSLRAGNSAPTGGNFTTAGTQLATSGSIADTTSSVSLTSSDQTTVYQYRWVVVTASSGGTIYVSQANFTEMFGATLNVGSRGEKGIRAKGGTTLIFSGSDYTLTIAGGTGSFYSFIFDTSSDSWWIQPIGVVAGQPMESFVQVANECNVPAWLNIPFYATDDYVTQFATYVAQNHTPSGPVFEYLNECWNPGMACTQRANVKGAYIYAGTFNAWYGVRFRQIAALVRAAFLAAGRRDAVMMFGVAGNSGDSPGNTASMIANRFQAAGIPDMAGANAPILHADMFCYGLYYAGVSYIKTSLVSTGAASWESLDSAHRTTLKGYVDGWLAGSEDAAYDWISDDILANTNLQGRVSNLETAATGTIGAASYEVPMCQYEAGHEISPPTTSWASQSPISNSAYGGDGGYIAQMMHGYMRSRQFYDLVSGLLQGWQGDNAHMRYCSLFSMCGGHPWMNFPPRGGATVVDPNSKGGSALSTDVPFQSWYAHQKRNAGYKTVRINCS